MPAGDFADRLLGQYLRDRTGNLLDVDLAGMGWLYKNLHALNREFGCRLWVMADHSTTFMAGYFLNLFTFTQSRGVDEMLEPGALLFSVNTLAESGPD